MVLDCEPRAVLMILCGLLTEKSLTNAFQNKKGKIQELSLFATEELHNNVTYFCNEAVRSKKITVACVMKNLYIFLYVNNKLNYFLNLFIMFMMYSIYVNY